MYDDDGELPKMANKGLVLDDMTWTSCPEKIIGRWPNTIEPVTSIRTNAPWREMWGKGYADTAAQENAWDQLAKYVKTHNAKVLIGQDMTCNDTSDDIQWKLNLKMIEKIGAENVMGLAVGNEMDDLHNKEWGPPACINRLYSQGHFWTTFQSRVHDFDERFPGNTAKLTVVWTMSPTDSTGTPFRDDPDAMVNTFVTNAYEKYKDRWVWTFNPYPFWAGGLQLDPGTTNKCSKAITETRTNMGAEMLSKLRQRIKQVTHNDDDTLWVGEMGWTSPKPDKYPPQLGLVCPDFTSLATFAGYYEHFLKWDLTLTEAKTQPNTLKGPDHAFFFTMRDAGNGGIVEHFGIVETCESTECKINLAPPSPPATSTCKTLKCGNHDSTCWCNTECKAHGSCCPDYDSVCGSGPSPPPTPSEHTCASLGCGNHDAACWCTPQCTTYNNCCKDYQEQCGHAKALLNASQDALVAV